MPLISMRLAPARSAMLCSRSVSARVCITVPTVAAPAEKLSPCCIREVSKRALKDFTAISPRDSVSRGTATAEAILKRYNSYNVTHPTYKALAEVGKAEKSIFLCDYLPSRRLPDGLADRLRANGHEAHLSSPMRQFYCVLSQRPSRYPISEQDERGRSLQIDRRALSLTPGSLFAGREL